MFWGLIMEPGRCYTQTVKVSFHVSMAAIDISNSGDEPSQIMCVFEGRNYLLCTLNKKDKLQCPLDLNFEAGTKVSFATNGKSHVHLTGYLTSIEDDFDEEETQEEENETETVEKKEKKRPKKEITEGPPTKKSKVIQNNTSEEVEEESSDSDFDLGELEEEEEEGDEEEDEEQGEEEDIEEEEASSLSEAESEEEIETVKPKQNGVTKANAVSKQKNKKEQGKTPPPKEKPKKQEEKKEQQDQKKQPKLKKTVLKGGVIVQDLKEGSGDLAKNGKFVHVYYEGRFKDNNKMFDSTTKGPGFSFRVGKGEVIKGWDIGLVGMKVGGKRRIICPPNVGYGPKGSPPVIPPNATLVFDVELKKIS